MSNNKKKNGDSKKIITMLVLIVIVMICTTSATYAYLAISATATNNITGTVATASLAFQLSNSATTTSGVPSITAPTSSTYTSSSMVPQYAYNNATNVLALAYTGATGKDKCVDGNGNVVCKVYTFTIRNNSTATVVVDGKIKFSTPTANLKWALMTNATTVPSITSTTDTDIHTASTSDVAFATNLSLVPSGGATSTSAATGSYKQYWIIFWINETGATQTDSGSWSATVTFTSSNGTGITSTITG